MINKDELLFVVDENNNPIEPLPRGIVHSKGFWHRSSHIWVVNSKKQILCQKRSKLKDKFPGFWEPNFGGNLDAGEGYLAGAVREGNEELNLKITKNALKFFKVFKSEVAREFVSIYLFKWDRDIEKIDFEKDEIDKLKWVPFEKLKEILLVKKEKSWTNLGYNKIMLTWIEKNFIK